MLRVVQPDGQALHVMDVGDDPDRAEKLARRTGGAVYEDRQAAIWDTLERAGATR